jgi:hypothetical protein
LHGSRRFGKSGRSSRKCLRNLLALFANEQQKREGALQQSILQEDAARFFNKPGASAAFSHWSKAAYWTIDEGVALILGRDPNLVTWEGIKPYVKRSLFASSFNRIRDLALRAKFLRQIENKMPPADFVAWALDLDLPVSEELLTELEKRGHVTDWKRRCEELQVQLEKQERELDELKQLRGDRSLGAEVTEERVAGLSLAASVPEREGSERLPIVPALPPASKG